MEVSIASESLLLYIFLYTLQPHVQTSMVWIESKISIKKQVRHCNSRTQHVLSYHLLFEYWIYDEPSDRQSMTGIFTGIARHGVDIHLVEEYVSGSRFTSNHCTWEWSSTEQHKSRCLLSQLINKVYIASSNVFNV